DYFCSSYSVTNTFIF
nr:immunoglobulin light chain junction region [Macaca mulatta]